MLSSTDFCSCSASTSIFPFSTTQTEKMPLALMAPHVVEQIGWQLTRFIRWLQWKTDMISGSMVRFGCYKQAVFITQVHCCKSFPHFKWKHTSFDHVILKSPHGQRNNILKLNSEYQLIFCVANNCMFVIMSSMKASQLASQYSGWSVEFDKEGSGGDARSSGNSHLGAPEFFWVSELALCLSPPVPLHHFCCLTFCHQV